MQRPLQMKLIPGGTFSMGTEDSLKDLDAQPVHQVTLDSFYMDSAEVTQELYYEYMAINPAYWAGDKLLPVENVSWFDAVLFCNARSKREAFHLDTVYSYSAAHFRRITETGKESCSTLTNCTIDLSKTGYRLPTEAEWEYACRAGTTTECYWGSAVYQDTVDRYAWFVYNAAGRHHPVGLKLPNQYGLYDMIGNVSEWCNDWYATGYRIGSAVSPAGPETGTRRVHRSSTYTSSATTLRPVATSASRGSARPERNSPTCGFRCVLKCQ